MYSFCLFADNDCEEAAGAFDEEPVEEADEEAAGAIDQEPVEKADENPGGDQQ